MYHEKWTTGQKIGGLIMLIVFIILPIIFAVTNGPCYHDDKGRAISKGCFTTTP